MNDRMILLNKNQYEKILIQLKSVPFNTLFARAVLESKVFGKVFVDNINKPKSIFIAHEYGMSLLFGDTENLEFNLELKKYLLNENKDRSNYEWLQVYPEKWNDKLKELLNDKIINYSKLLDNYSKSEADILTEKYRENHIIQWGRVNFIYKDIDKAIFSKSEYEIKLIDSEIYDRIEGSVIPKFFWKSKELFLSVGIGYALMNGDDIVSIAFSSCKFDNVLEIGVETSEKYRNMGFAKHVCQELLSYCKKNNYSPIWACRLENTGSYLLAKSLGFEEVITLPYYELIKI